MNQPHVRPLPRTQADRTAESDARMLEAAVRLICEKGPEGATLREVGERAGYSRGLAGVRFGSKASLYRYVVHAIGEEWLGELGAAVGDKVGLAAIRAAVDAHYRFVSQASERIRAFYILWFNSIGPDPELKAVIAHIHARRQQDVEAWLRGGVRQGDVRSDADIAGAARQFCAAIIGVVYQWLVTPADRDLIGRLHEDIKAQMSLALAPAGPQPANRRSGP
jgi:AcrR family transcriptional regulator